MKICSTRLFTLLMLLAYGHAATAADIPKPASMIPFTKSEAVLILDRFSNKLRSHGLKKVDFALENITLIDQAESHPLYQMQIDHHNYMLDSCTGLIRFYRDDLNLQLTKGDVQSQSVKWLSEAKVKKIAIAVRNALLPKSA